MSKYPTFRGFNLYYENDSYNIANVFSHQSETLFY
jgi:hypothetical protein